MAVRNPIHLEHLQRTLEKTDTRKVDIVAVSVHRVTQAASGEHDLGEQQIFSTAETQVFTKVVTLAEAAGKHVELLAVAGTDPWVSLVQTAAKLESSRVVTGLSPLFAANPAEQGKVIGAAWEELPQPRPSLSLEILLPDGESIYYDLGPHPPRLWPQDIELVHQLWLELAEKGPGAKLHHRDIVGVALRRFKQELHSEREHMVIADVFQEVADHPQDSLKL